MGALLACALAVRLGLAWGVQQRVERTPGRLCLVAGDAEGYWELARNVVQRGEFTLYTPPRRVLRMPGFPLWLAAGMRLFGERVLWHRLGLACVGTVACGLTCLLGWVLGGRSVGRCAGWLAALHPGLAGLSVLLLSETLFACCLTASLVCLALLLRSVRDHSRGANASAPREPTGLAQAASSRATGSEALFGPSWLWGGLCGVLCGLATLVRPTWLPIAPLVALWLLLGRTPAVPRARLRGPALALLAGLVLTMTPWAWRNWRVVGHPVVTSLWAGASLYDGLHPGATGVSDMRFIEADGLFDSLTEYEVDRHYRAAAQQFAWNNPRRVFELGVVKLSRFWNPLLNAGELDPGPIGWLLGAWELALWVAALRGLWHWRRDCWAVCLTAGPVLFLSLVHCVFIGSVRYRLPAEYALLVASAVGLLVTGIPGRSPAPRGVG